MKNRNIQPICPVPHRHLEMMREIIESPDAIGTPTYRWPMTLQADYFTYRDPADGISSEIWSPVRAFHFLLLLTIPIKPTDARSLKSRGPFKADCDLSRYARLNGRMQFSPGPEMTSIFWNMSAWQARFNPLIGEDLSLSARLDTRGHGYLFRDPASASPQEPLMYGRVRTFWVALQKELESRLATEGIEFHGGQARAMYDLKSIRAATACTLMDLYVEAIQRSGEGRFINCRHWPTL